MDDRTVDLACAALEEFLRAGRFGGKSGEAVTAFLEHMAVCRSPAPVVQGSPGALESPAAQGAEVGRLQTLQREVEALRTSLAQAENALGQWEKKNQDLARRIQDADAQSREAREAARAAEAMLKAQAAQRLREQDELFALQHFLDSVPASARDLFASYFDTGDLVNFLVQCGQFSRINQLWEACGKAVTAGQSPAGLTPFLERLLGLFNRASGQNPATLIAPAPGDAYRSEFHYRVNSDGTTVRTLLLPGLRNPGGKMQQPALVELK